MGKSLGAVCLALTLMAGCCENPGVFQKVQQSLDTVQGYYTPLLQEEWQQNEQLRRAVVAADTALMVAGELQRQWCPDPGKTEQLQLQTQEAQTLAQEAGVKAAGAAGK
ncbi:MAG: hypothetical protein ACYDIC_06085 [Desulfobaccales bacterium]